MKRTFALMALLALFGLQHTVSAAIIKKVAPTFWWADMKKYCRHTGPTVWRQYFFQ